MVLLRADHVSAQFLRFLLTGVLNTLFGYGLFALLILAGLGPFPALALATIGGLLFNFQTIGRLVFRRGGSWRLLRFVGVYAVVFLVNWAGLRTLMDAGFGPMLAQGLLLPLVVLLAFTGNKLLVFGVRR